MAIAAMVLGIAGLAFAPCLWFFPVLPILGIVLGHVSLGQVNRRGTPGRGFSVSGMVTGYAGLGLSLIFLLLVFLGTITSPTPTF